MKIAIIGGGISAISAAYLLGNEHSITIYDKNNYLGGHSRTITVADNVAVDTGFIVFNKKTYPNLTNFFTHLGVNIAKSDMSFGISNKSNNLEYGTSSLSAIFCQRNNITSGAFLRMLIDIVRFNRAAPAYLNSDNNESLGELITRLKLSNYYRDNFLLPMGAAIWSTPMQGMLDFPAKTFIRFFKNHGLLSITNQPQWYTVDGGSKEYIKKFTDKFSGRIHCGSEVISVSKQKDGIEVVTRSKKIDIYDHVIMACHADEACDILAGPMLKGREALKEFKFHHNQVMTHSDTNFMPKNKAAWSSWVYLSDKYEQVSLSYWMNNLQPFNSDKPIIVTVNPATRPEGEIYDNHHFAHPIFNQAAIDAQASISTIQGKDNIWFAGAWLRYGFHEDGFISGMNVATKLGAKLPW